MDFFVCLFVGHGDFASLSVGGKRAVAVMVVQFFVYVCVGTFEMSVIEARFFLTIQIRCD